MAPSNVPLLDANSAKPLTEFSACFTEAQDHSGRAWAYMPDGNGGTFTDSGARGASASYWLQVRGSAAATHVRLFAADAAVAKAVELCG